MLATRTLLTLSSILFSVLITHAYARRDGMINEEKGESSPAFATSLTGGEGCDPSDLEDIHDGFAEMAHLYVSILPYDSTSTPSVEFFGTLTRSGNYTDMVATNLQRAANYGMLAGTKGAVNGDIHVRCDDPMGICKLGNKREGNHAAYNIGNDAHVVFCKDYFQLGSLDKTIDKKSNNQMEREKLWSYYNRAALWARMVMHFSDIGKAVVHRATPGGPNSTSEWTINVSEGAMNTSVLAGVLNERPETNSPKDPQTLKYAYGATRSKLLAVLSTQMPYDAANNAENYALYALGQYIVKRKGFYPSVPIMDFPNEATVLTNENLQDGERNKYANFDMPDVV